MSILITGMEMPKEGTVFVIDSTGQVWSNEWPTRGYTRLDGVKAVPVPPHGRLGDLDAALKKLERIALPDGLSYTIGHDIAKQFLKNAPTIIEAEESET